MASQVITPTSVIREYPSEVKKVPAAAAAAPSGEPLLDQEGNVLPYPTYKAGEEDKYGQISRIPHLAAVAALGGRIPTAGEYAIEHSKEPQPDVQFPPECYLYDEDRPWVLGKLNPEALDLPEPVDPIPLPQHVLDQLDAFEAATNEAIKQRVKEEEETDLIDEAQGNKPVEKNATLAPQEKAPLKYVPAKVVATKIDAALSHASSKPKSRTASISPGKGVTRASPVRTSSPSLRSEKVTAATTRPKTPKSPGRGVSPQAKIVASSRSGSKKIMNAKVDLEIVEKKN